MTHWLQRLTSGILQNSSTKRFLRTLILLLIRLVGLPRSVVTTYKAIRSTEPRILLIRPDHLGDVLLTTPVLDAIKERVPHAHITMMVGPWSSEVVERHPAIDSLIICPFPGFQRAPQHPLAPYRLLLKMSRQLPAANYDIAINLRPDFWWGAALIYLADIQHRLGYAIEPGKPFLTIDLPLPKLEHATISNLRLANVCLQILGHTVLVEPYTPKLYPLKFAPTLTEIQWIDKCLQEAGIETEAPVVVIHPGAGSAVKLWRSEGWANCANTLTRMLTFPTQARIVLSGSESERALLEEIAQLMDDDPLIMSNMTLGQLAALLGRATLVLGVDSGPLHLAVAQNTPTIQIFGPSDVRIFGPWGTHEHHIIIKSTHRCPTCPMIPCNRLDFSPEELDDHPCVKRVTEQEVETVIASILGISETWP